MTRLSECVANATITSNSEFSRCVLNEYKHRVAAAVMDVAAVAAMTMNIGAVTGRVRVI